MQYDFPKMKGDWGQRQFGTFQKFIRFDDLIRPDHTTIDPLRIISTYGIIFDNFTFWQILTKTCRGGGGDLYVQVPPILTLSYRRCEKKPFTPTSQAQTAQSACLRRKNALQLLLTRKNIIHFILSNQSLLYFAY